MREKFEDLSQIRKMKAPDKRTLAQTFGFPEKHLFMEKAMMFTFSGSSAPSLGVSVLECRSSSPMKLVTKAWA